MQRLRVIDSHTGGEPTRVVIEGGPELVGGSVAEQLARLRDHHDWLRSTVVHEPRGSEVMVGALLCAPRERDCAAGVIFFNNVGYLGMCGHGAIGLIATLAHLGRIGPGVHRIDTPVGVVTATLLGDGSVAIGNVVSYRKVTGAAFDVEGFGKITGDIAWGGNWFFLTEDHGLRLELGATAGLAELAGRVRRAVNAQGYPEVDHIELVGPAASDGAQARNFVLCPGGAYDRSPCGTGTSAKLACLAADRKLAPGETFVIESILGSRFAARYQWIDEACSHIAPEIAGTAFVNGEATLLIDPRDPFRHGIR